MSDQWVQAKTALEIIGDRFTLCTRLFRGLVIARAAAFHVDDMNYGPRRVPKEFWWATGHQALEQNWDSGDFSTWIDNKRHLQAFGVSISLTGLLELVEIERRPLIARSLSVTGNPSWVSASAAVQLGCDLLGSGPSHPVQLIKQQASFGFLAATAVTAQGINTDYPAAEMMWAEREWNIPAWFWTLMAVNEPTDEDWVLGNFSVTGGTPTGLQTIMLKAVHFHRDSLIPVFGRPDVEEASTAPRGRKRKYDWDAATASVWGRIYRGELIPENQADVERAFITALTNGDKEPSESTVRPYAHRLWIAFDE